MLKIAILVREETALRCTGQGCLRSFFARTESFAGYRGMDVELTGFFHSGGDLDYKLTTMKEAGVQVIHVSTCMRGKYPGYQALVEKIGRDFDVIGYTHGSENGRTTATVSVTGKYI
ncbi:CGGC domain-containing protein [Desulfocastanea catecholica]